MDSNFLTFLYIICIRNVNKLGTMKTGITQDTSPRVGIECVNLMVPWW